MKMRFFLFVCLCGAFSAVPVYSEDPLVGPALTLAQVLSMAREKNPDILAARQSWQVAQAQVGPAGTWPNPTFSYVDEKFPSGTPGGAPQLVKHYRVQQAIPFPGKLSDDAQMLHHETLIAEANYHSKIIDVLGEVRMRYYQLSLTDRKIELADRSVQGLKIFLKTAQSRLASGQSTTSDVFMAQLELRKTENSLFQQRQARTLAQIELNTLLDRPTESPWGPAAAPDLVDVPVSLAEIQVLARENAPQYQAAAHEINHAQAMLSRNHLEYAPDFDVMYERETSPGAPPGRQIGFGVTFPLWLQRPRGLYKKSQEHVTETQSIAKAMENKVMKMVHVEYTETVTHLTLARNYQTDILPAAQSNLNIAREQYASGRGDFLRILEALRAWIEVHNEYQNELYSYGEHWSRLEQWVGVELSKENLHAR